MMKTTRPCQPALLLFWMFLTISSAFGQDEFDLAAGSEDRRALCQQFTDYGLAVMNDREQRGLSAEDIVRTLEIEMAGGNEDMLWTMRIVTDIANSYFDSGISAAVAEIDLMHPCVTQAVALDLVWIEEWLRVMPTDHPEYAAIRFLNGLSADQVEEVSGMTEEELQAFSGTASIQSFTPGELLTDLQATATNFTAFEMRSAGVVEGCGIEFNVWGRDWAYAEGGITVFTGSINLQYAAEKQALYMSLKVNSNDVDSETGQPVGFEIPYAYLQTSDLTTAGAEYASFVCDNGAFCSAWVEPIEGIVAGIFDNDIDLMYQRNDGGLDVAVDLDINLDDDIEAMLTDWYNCFDELSGLVLAE